MNLRLATLLVVFSFAALTASAKPVPVGNVTRSQAALLHGVGLRAGTTIFSGDSIETRTGGSVWIALPGGAQAQIQEDSTARIVSDAGGTRVIVERGRAQASAGVSVINSASPHTQPGDSRAGIASTLGNQLSAGVQGGNDCHVSKSKKDKDKHCDPDDD